MICIKSTVLPGAVVFTRAPRRWCQSQPLLIQLHTRLRQQQLLCFRQMYGDLVSSCEPYNQRQMFRLTVMSRFRRILTSVNTDDARLSHIWRKTGIGTHCALFSRRGAEDMKNRHNDSSAALIQAPTASAPPTRGVTQWARAIDVPTEPPPPTHPVARTDNGLELKRLIQTEHSSPVAGNDNIETPMPGARPAPDQVPIDVASKAAEPGQGSQNRVSRSLPRRSGWDALGLRITARLGRPCTNDNVCDGHVSEIVKLVRSLLLRIRQAET